MQRAHFSDELLLGLAHVQQGLPRLGVAEEDDEIHRMAGTHRHAHLRVVLEAADAGAMAGAGIDDDIGAAAIVDRHAIGRDNFQQRVIDGPLELAPVQNGLVAKMQDRLEPLHGVFDKVVAPLPERVPEQDGTLHAVDGIGIAAHRIHAGHRRGRAGARIPNGLLDASTIGLLRNLQAPLQHHAGLQANFTRVNQLLCCIHAVLRCESCDTVGQAW